MSGITFTVSGDHSIGLGMGNDNEPDDLARARRRCPHENMSAHVDVGHLADDPAGKSTASIKIWCGDCNEPFVFVGLPVGFTTMGGAMRSLDGTEAHLVVLPRSRVERAAPADPTRPAS